MGIQHNANRFIGVIAITCAIEKPIIQDPQQGIHHSRYQQDCSEARNSIPLFGERNGGNDSCHNRRQNQDRKDKETHIANEKDLPE